ncbi:MAG TPA: LysM peptidoglycan-binding domain-containing protein [Phycisphaerales bacterium]|nr:LysM peptidoglycan-binding domain-containing protein [Phycisphaerales bacterium]
MADNATRIIGFSCVLVGVWIITYWLWTPMGPRVVVDDRPGALPTGASEEVAPPTPPASSPSVSPASDAAPGPEAAGPRTVMRVLAPRFRDYVVQPGDTSFEKIAERPEVFGDAGKGEAIARANKFADPTKLKPGITVLRIPLDPDNIEGRLVQVVQAPGEPATVVTPPAPPTAPTLEPTAPMRTYTLKSGDTLWDVARKFYGKGALWKLIANANTDTVPHPNRPPIGVTIRIPPEPAPKSEKTP